MKDIGLRRKTIAREGVGLTEEEVKHFHREGYVVAKGLLGSEELDPLLMEFDKVLTTICRELYEKGELSSDLSDLPFEQRYKQLIIQTGNVYASHFRPTLPAEISSITRNTPCSFNPAVFAVIRSKRLLGAVESLIGSEIFANPIQNVRVKPPTSLIPARSMAGTSGLVAATPWHQDTAVCSEDSDKSNIVTTWFPLHDVSETNGPLVIIPRSHLDGLADHCVSDSTKEVMIPDISKSPCSPLLCPLEKGDVLFLHKLTMHASVANTSQNLRISLDLRYNKVGEPSGRDLLPGFIAQSKKNPELEMKNAEAWKKVWLDLKKKFAEKNKEESENEDENEKKPPHILLGRDRWLNDPNRILCA